MPSTSDHLSIELAWSEDGVSELRVSAANARFHGECELYATTAEIAAFAEALRDFPKGTDDRRLHQLGTFDEGSPGGGLRVGCSIVDARREAGAPTEAGSGRVDVELVSAGRNGSRRQERLCLQLVVAERSFGRFVEGIDRMIDVAASRTGDRSGADLGQSAWLGPRTSSIVER